MSEFDQDLVEGDIIVAFYPGFHRVTGIESRYYGNQAQLPGWKTNAKVGDEFNSIIEYQRIMDEDGVAKEDHYRYRSDSSHCGKIDAVWIQHQREGNEQKLQRICETIGILYER